MTGVSDLKLWGVIIALGLGTYLIRYSFLGIVGGRQLPDWSTRLLRFVPVTVLPALAAPMVAFPKATGGEAEPTRIAAAMVALAVGASTRNALAAIFSGMAVLWGAKLLMG